MSDRSSGQGTRTLRLPSLIHRKALVKPYLVSLAVGVLVGAIYALLRVRSPAPPVIALAGLLGMLVGEQGVSIARALVQPARSTASTAISPCPHPPGNRHAP